jgi:hypothetical protein
LETEVAVGRKGRRLGNDPLREAGRDEVKALKAESQRLKQLVADYALEVMALNRAGRGYGS